jgi:raffinose/stachyose/melibiose transport system permease protein
MAERDEKVAYLFVAPALVLFAVYIFYPLFYILYSGFFEWDGINERTWIGLQNYVKLFTGDPVFWIALRNIVYWIFLTIFPQMFLGFFLAYALNQRMMGRILARAIFYLPAIISAVVIGIVFERIYNPYFGVLSGLADVTGLNILRQPYVSDPDLAIFSAIAANVWRWTGFSMLMYLAGLQTIDDELLECAEMSGASRWQAIRFVQWPMLRSVHLTLILLGVIGALKEFELVFVLTDGGPNNASQLLSTYIFRQGFTLQHMGYGSALSVLTVLFALGLTIFQIRAFGSRFALQ